MTRQETGIIMDILSTAYPRFYAGKDAPDPRMTMSLWEEMFADEPVELVAAAVKALIATDDKGFPPHIGAVKGRIRQITQPMEMTEVEAWGLVSRAVRKLDWLAPEKQFNKLPPDIQSAIGSPHTLVEWGKMDEDAFGSVAASNFQRSYRARRAATREFEALPSDIKSLALGFTKQLSLDEET